MTDRPFAYLLPLLLVALVFGGCAHRGAWDEERVFQVSGPLEIDVESFGGDVLIEATDTWPNAVVRVKREAVHGHRRTKEAEASLDQISYEVEIAPGELGQQLRIRTMTTHGEPHFQRAHVRIQVPEVEGVYVRTRRGRVFVRGVTGQIDIATTEGDVRVVSNRALTRPVTIRNERGSIDYRVRGESTGFFDCEAVRGEVSRHIRYGYFTSMPGSSHRKLLGRLNDGDNPIKLRTVDGDIRISVIHNPERVGMFIRH